jgi:lipoprotein-anchoring transpeptidase ErfK/SrfK
MSIVRSRTFVAVALVLVLLLGAAGVLMEYAASANDTIAHGVKVGGVDVGGMSAAKARAHLQQAYVARLGQPVVASYHHHVFMLSPKDSGVAVDIDGAVQQALQLGRDQGFFTRAWRGLTGGRIDAAIDPSVTFSHAAVDRLVKRVAQGIDRPPRDASVSYGGDSLGSVTSRPGASVDQPALRASLERALANVYAPHEVAIRVVDIAPKVTTAQLSAQYPTVITIDRSTFQLRLWKHLQLVKTYTIAVGMAGLQTPAGLYHVQDKEVDPSWHVPNSAWAGSLAGQTIPPGPADPLKARWMGIYNGAGIHGTDDLASLGSAASHGCIRMSVPDVIELYGQTPLGSPVYIV